MIMLSQILFYLLVGWSISSTVVNGSIFDSIRNWCLVKAPFFGKLLSCIRCFSFWIGAFLFGFLTFKDQFPAVFVGFPVEINYVFFPFVQSGFSVIMESFVIFLIKDRSVKIYEESKSENGKNSEHL